jgi:hypothetical protein
MVKTDISPAISKPSEEWSVGQDIILSSEKQKEMN